MKLVAFIIAVAMAYYAGRLAERHQQAMIEAPKVSTSILSRPTPQPRIYSADNPNPLDAPARPVGGARKR